MNKNEVEKSIEKLIENMKCLDISITETTKESLISMEVWDWSQGVALFSLYLYYQETKRQDILEYLIDWFDKHIKKGLPGKNVNTMCPMLTLSYLYEDTKNEKYRKLCEDWAEYIVNDMPKTPEGGITHVTVDSDNEGQLWDDTLYMTVLFLGRMGKLLGKDEYIQESIRQFLVHLKYLTDVTTGLFFHGWTFCGNHNFAKALWGRGNAWYTAGLVDYLDMVDIPSGVSDFLITSLERQISKLKELQTEEGMWRTLLDDETSYVESSATAGFTYGILKAVRKGYIDKKYQEQGLKGAQAILDRIDAKGVLQDVSYGTRVGDTLDFYKKVSINPMPYGQSMALLMLVELNKHL